MSLDHLNGSGKLNENNFQREESRIDFKRVLYRSFRYWYVIVISLGIALAIAVFKNRYTPRVYPVVASIMVHETEEVGSGDFVYKNEIVKPYRNYLNELYFLKSYPLVESVIRDLHFDVSFYQEGNVITSEIYDLPVEVYVFNDSEIGSFSSTFSILNTSEFQLKSGGKGSSARTFRFNDTVSFMGLRALFKKSDSVKLKKSGEYVFSYTSPKRLAASYAGTVNASWAEKGAGVINLYSTGTNPQKSLDFMAGLIKRYQMYDLEKKNQKASNTIAFINGQLEEISDSLRLIEGKMERFKKTHLVTNHESETTRLYSKLEGIEVQKTEIIIRENYYRYLMDYVSRGTDLEQVILPASVGLPDPLLGEMLKKMTETEADLKQGVIKGNASNPLVQERRKKLQEIRNGIIESMKNQLNTDKIKLGFIDKQIREVENQLGGLPAAEREFVAIKRSYSLLENLYVFLLQKKAEAAISKASATSDIEVINEPATGGPIYPKPSQNYFLAIFIGLAIPLSIFTLIEYFNTRLQSKEDIEKITTIPFVGGLGHKLGKGNLVVINAPKSAMAEYFRSLRSNLSYFLNEKEKAVILVSSSISGEGKTFTSINLASIIAFTGKRTLLVGADMRKPKMVADFKLSNDKGLSSYLVDICSFDEIVQKTEVNNLDLISGGPVPPNPAELMLRPQMERFFQEARNRYEFVIVDSPPMAIVSDANNLTKHCDHLLFIVRQNYTQKDFLRSIDDFYRIGRIKDVSIVLNDIYKSGPGYGFGTGYGYGYGYSYRFASQKAKNGYGYYTENTNS